MRAPEYHVHTVLEARRVGPGHRRRAASQGREAGTWRRKGRALQDVGQQGTLPQGRWAGYMGRAAGARGTGREGQARRTGTPPRGPESSSRQGPSQGLRAVRTEGSENTPAPVRGPAGCGCTESLSPLPCGPQPRSGPEGQPEATRGSRGGELPRQVCALYHFLPEFGSLLLATFHLLHLGCIVALV